VFYEKGEMRRNLPQKIRRESPIAIKRGEWTALDSPTDKREQAGSISGGKDRQRPRRPQKEEGVRDPRAQPERLPLSRRKKDRWPRSLRGGKKNIIPKKKKEGSRTKKGIKLAYR